MNTFNFCIGGGPSFKLSNGVVSVDVDVSVGVSSGTDAVSAATTDATAAFSTNVGFATAATSWSSMIFFLN